MADPAGRSGVLVELRGDDHRRRLELTALDRARPERVGPPIEGTAGADVVAVAAQIGASSRVAYLDAPARSVEPSYLRVVELRRGEWWDVAPPLRTVGSVGATFVGDELVVVAISTERAESHRLRDGAWLPVTITLPRLSEPE